MAILFYPFPLAQPNSALPQYVVGDFYVSQNGAPVQLTYNAITRKNAWTKYTSAPVVGGISASINGGPPLISSTLVSSKSVTGGQSVNFTPVTVYGGSATATSFSTTGTVTTYQVSISPALPVGLSLSNAASIKSVTGADSVPRLYNSMNVSVTGTPVGSLANTTFTITFTDAGGQTATASFDLTVEAGTSPLSTTQAVATKTLIQGTAATSFIPVTATGGDAPLAFAVSPSLPTGLSINSTTGAITGTPSVAIAATVYTVTVTDAGGQISSKTFTLTVEAPAVTTVLAQASYSFTRTIPFTAFRPVSASGGIGTLSYSISPSLPTGMSINSSTGNISGTATTTSPVITYTVTVTDSNTPAQTSSKSFTITVAELPALNSTLLIPTSTLTKNSQSYSFTPVSASGGYGTLAYAISPSLSAGLSFSTTTGQITGVATALRSVTTYTVTVTDQASQSTDKSFTIEVVPGALLTVQAVSNRVAVRNVAIGTFTPVTASGGDGTLAYAVSPGLPTGLTFNTSSGAISGTPTIISGATSYTVTVTDQASQNSSKTFTLTVEAPPVITTQAIPSKILTQYDLVTPFIPVTATGGYGALTYVISPSLPTGLSFAAGTGSVSGTPRQYLVTATTFSVTVSDTALQSSTATFLLTVNTKPLLVQSAVANKTLIRSVSTTPYIPVTATGGSETYAYSLSSSLPTGLSFSTSTGRISGTPTVTSSTATYTVTVTDTLNVSGTSTFNLNIIDPPALVTTSLVTSSTFYRQVDSVDVTPISASGGYGSISFAISPTLPTGLTFNASNGRITGIATQLSSQAYTISATDSIGQNSSKSYSLTITYTPLATTLAVLSSTVTRSKAITAFTPVTASGGNGLITFAISPSLPTGLTFNVTTGQVSGTPSISSTTTAYTVTATDSSSNTSSKSFNLTVNDPPALITTATTASVTLTVNQAVTSFTPVTAFGGDGQITFVIGPVLPTGLIFDVSNGAVRGTPTALSTTATYTVTATDALSQISSKSFELNVKAQPVSVTVNNSTLIFIKYSSITPTTPVTASGGSGQITYALDIDLPSGLTFNSSTGEITGTPTAASSATTYTVTATDNIGQQNSGVFSLTVNDFIPDPLIAVAPTNAYNLDIDTTSTFTPVTASGGFGTYTFSINPLELPTGLTFNTTNGDITGTPTEVSTSQNYTVTVTDSVPQSASAVFLLSVISPIPTQGKGYTGSRGFIGYTGSRGVVGFTGSAGAQGNLGYTGSTGTQGAVGYTGSTGTQGAVGYTGSIGTQGAVGYVGSAGTQGAVGYTGSRGNAGYTGSKGDTGIGYTGSAGAGSSIKIIDETTTITNTVTSITFLGDGVSAASGGGGSVVVTISGGGGGGAVYGNLDGGQPDSNYGGITSIDAGGVSG